MDVITSIWIMEEPHEDEEISGGVIAAETEGPLPGKNFQESNGSLNKTFFLGQLRDNNCFFIAKKKTCKIIWQKKIFF